MSEESVTTPAYRESENENGEEPLTTVRLQALMQQEIEERRRVEEALKAAEENYRLIIDTIPQILWGANEKGWVDFVHHRIENTTGVTAAEVLRAGWLSVVHPEDRAGATDRWLKSLMTGIFYESEFRIVQASGDYLWYMASALPVRDAGGNIVRWFGTLTNIDERRRLQEQVEAERMIALKNQRRFLREMLFGMTEGRLCICSEARELPTPLNSASDEIELAASTLRGFRETIETKALSLGFARPRTRDLMTAASEAATNTVQHAGGGSGRICSDPDTGAMQIWVQDKGKGIAEHLIHRAVESGWTTGGFGQGFHLMWKTCDRLYLFTGSEGTTVVLEMNRTPPNRCGSNRNATIEHTIGISGVGERRSRALPVSE